MVNKNLNLKSLLLYTKLAGTYRDTVHQSLQSRGLSYQLFCWLQVLECNGVKLHLFQKQQCFQNWDPDWRVVGIWAPLRQQLLWAHPIFFQLLSEIKIKIFVKIQNWDGLVNKLTLIIHTNFKCDYLFFHSRPELTESNCISYMSIFHSFSFNIIFVRFHVYYWGWLCKNLVLWHLKHNTNGH